MSDDNVGHLRVAPGVRRRNRLGKRAVPCEISDRWLQFPETSDAVLGIGDMMVVAVMTNAFVGPRKLCDLTISREDLAKALSNVKSVRRE